ncbi:hypothetical protein Bpfe_004605 [Biomphalaria pfeifferi]|uniref:Uncharacterized protein n=1 Tax=Biomphalaria pfeifferi TaxID=112525 RepID=A0AAD8FJ38_BIOPF|nr:hypothetical protein Bpfe_004605 [Biomphalaria pfeifferi]
MSYRPACQKVIKPDAPEIRDMTVEEYVRPPCTPLYPPCNRKVRSPEPEPEMPICPCPPPSLPPCRSRPNDEECCKITGSAPRKFPKPW